MVLCNDKIYYKAVQERWDRLWSYNPCEGFQYNTMDECEDVFLGGRRIEYAPYKWVRPIIPGTQLMAFSSIGDAVSFVGKDNFNWIQNHEGITRLYRCICKHPSTKGIFTKNWASTAIAKVAANYRNNPSVQAACAHDLFYEIGCKGITTIFATEIMLLDQVSSTEISYV